MLRICTSKEPFAKLQDVEALSTTMFKEGLDICSETRVRAQALDAKMGTNPDGNHMDIWSEDLLHAIDQAAIKHLSLCTNQLGINEDVYLSSLYSYITSVVKLIQAHVEDKEHAELIAARFKWAMQPRLHEMIPMPIMTDSMIDATFQSMDVVKHGILEVSNLCSFLSTSPRPLWMHFPQNGVHRYAGDFHSSGYVSNVDVGCTSRRMGSPVARGISILQVMSPM